MGDYNAPKADTKAGGGGGGGDRSIVEANKGKLPEKVKDPITPPQPQTIEKPMLPEPAAINVQKDIQLPDNMNMPMIGMHESANVTLASAGTGNGAGMGTGSGGGMGPGSGNGYGPGYGGNAGGGLYQIGGRVSAPVLIHSVEAEFSDEARRAKYQGVCLISLIVDAQGNPQNIRVVRALGMGLDEKAIEAIRQYKFKAGHEGRQDAGAGHDHHRGGFPAVLRLGFACGAGKRSARRSAFLMQSTFMGSANRRRLPGVPSWRRSRRALASTEPRRGRPRRALR